MARFFRDNGLTIALMLLFAGSIIGQWLAGWHFENQTLAEHGEEAITLAQFTTDPQFLSTVFENWESEFLQMAAFVVLTACLYQKGSAESEDPDEPPRDANLAAQARKKGAPSLLRMGASVRWVYAHSLGIVLAILFVGSFVAHWWFSAKHAAEEAAMHGAPALSVIDYLTSAQMWFESFQNWQSEFLSTAVLIVLSIYLRQAESPESKPVAAPHSQTGA
jgi:glycerol uptake facilitator-like aquaporin